MTKDTDLKAQQFCTLDIFFISPKLFLCLNTGLGVAVFRIWRCLALAQALHWVDGVSNGGCCVFQETPASSGWDAHAQWIMRSYGFGWGFRAAGFDAMGIRTSSFVVEYEKSFTSISRLPHLLLKIHPFSFIHEPFWISELPKIITLQFFRSKILPHTPTPRHLSFSSHKDSFYRFCRFYRI